MKLDTEKIIQLNSLQIYELLQSRIDRIYNNLVYFDITKDEYKKMILNVIEKTKKDYIANMMYERFVEKEIIKFLNIKTKGYLHTEQGFWIIINFINKNFKLMNSNIEVEHNYKILVNFLEKHDYKMSKNVYEELLNKSDGFSNMTLLLGDCMELVKCGNKENTNKERDEKQELDSVNSLALYLNSLKDIKVLSADEEKKLAMKVLNGDKNALNEFVIHNLKLVVMVAKKYAKDKDELADLIQVGNEELINTIKKFDPTMNVKFSTYAITRIKEKMVRYKYNDTVYRMSVYSNELNQKYNKAVSKLEITLSRYPTRKELANELGVSEEQVRRLEIIKKNVISINTSVDDENQNELGDIIPTNCLTPEDEYIKSIDDFTIKELLDNKNLTANERKVIYLKCGFKNNEPLKFVEISKILKLSSERIRQIYNSGIKKLQRDPLVRQLKY